MNKITLTFIALLAVIGQAFAQPKVVTNPVHARGATKAFGRSTITGVTVSSLKEHGFCWSTQPEPTILDNRTTLTFSNNGYIYRMENLTPSTVYYARAYITTNDSRTYYGDVIKIITIPKSNITYTYNNGGTADANTRIDAALKSAVNYWHDLTSVQNFNISCTYGSETPTADCNYNGNMRVGPNASYQRTGTILHEMEHSIGVGTHMLWYGPNSPLRANGTTGLWTGERANSVLRFWDNNQSVSLTGDVTHMWPTSSSIPYGINGSWEDTGSEILYIGNCLIVQALGEDGLPPTGGFATPAYTFLHDDAVKYYIKNESDFSGANESFLMENAAGNLVNVAINPEKVAANDSAAWYLSFNPATCYYQIRNVATGKYFTYSATGTNGIRLTTVATPSTLHSFQLMGARSSAEIGIGVNKSSVKGYWIVRPQATQNPPCLALGTGAATTVSTLSFTDAAKTQRWALMTGNEIQNIVDPEPLSPEVTATPVTSTYIKLTWDAAASARSYRIYRASYPDSIYTVLRNTYTSTSYEDSYGLTPNTIYWYKVSSVNNKGESNPVPVKVITNKENGEPGDGGLSIDFPKAENFRVYPNPVKAGQQISVDDENLTEELSIEIVDMTGKTVLQFFDNKSVYAPQIEGVYFIKLIAKNKTEVCKLIVK